MIDSSAHQFTALAAVRRTKLSHSFLIKKADFPDEI